VELKLVVYAHLVTTTPLTELNAATLVLLDLKSMLLVMDALNVLPERYQLKVLNALHAQLVKFQVLVSLSVFHVLRESNQMLLEVLVFLALLVHSLLPVVSVMLNVHLDILQPLLKKHVISVLPTSLLTPLVRVSFAQLVKFLLLDRPSVVLHAQLVTTLILSVQSVLNAQSILSLLLEPRD